MVIIPHLGIIAHHFFIESGFITTLRGNKGICQFDKMIEVYKPNGFDWMGTPITKDNPINVYQVCDGELSCVALLT